MLSRSRSVASLYPSSLQPVSTTSRKLVSKQNVEMDDHMVVAINRLAPKRQAQGKEGKCALASVGLEPTSMMRASTSVCGQVSSAKVDWFLGLRPNVGTGPAIVV